MTEAELGVRQREPRKAGGLETLGKEGIVPKTPHKNHGCPDALHLVLKTLVRTLDLQGGRQ